MKKLIATSLLVAFGCSSAGQDETEIATEGAAAPASDLTVIDEVTWQGERLRFYDVSTSPEEVPAIVIEQQGTGDELSLLFESQADYAVSPAELWRAATGQQDVPEELLRQHRWQALDEGRPEAFQEFGELDKAITRPDPSSLFPLTDFATGTTAVPRCWGNGVVMRMGDMKSASLCTGNGNAVRNNVPATTECNAAFNLNATVRAGMYNGTGTSFLGQTCFATGNQAWSCNAAAVVPNTAYLAATFVKNGQTHRMNSGYFLPSNITVGAGGALGTANLRMELRRFEDTACSEGFFKNF